MEKQPFCNVLGEMGVQSHTDGIETEEQKDNHNFGNPRLSFEWEEDTK